MQNFRNATVFGPKQRGPGAEAEGVSSQKTERKFLQRDGIRTKKLPASQLMLERGFLKSSPKDPQRSLRLRSAMVSGKQLAELNATGASSRKTERKFSGLDGFQIKKSRFTVNTAEKSLQIIEGSQNSLHFRNAMVRQWSPRSWDK